MASSESTPSNQNPSNPPRALPFPWNQGEHFAIIGDTGTGKSTLLAWLVQARKYTVIIKTKADPVKFPGKHVKRADSINDPRENRYVLQPVYDNQRSELHALFERAWVQNGWTLVVDELFYVDSLLKLDKDLARIYTQGRSKGLTVVAGMQRPVGVTRFALSQSTHLLSFRLDGRDAKTLGEATNKEVERAVQTLDRYEFLWYYRPERTFYIGRFDLDSEELVSTR